MKNPTQSNVKRKEELFGSQSEVVPSITVKKTDGKSVGEAGHTVSAVRKHRDECWYSGQAPSPCLGWVFPLQLTLSGNAPTDITSQVDNED